MLLNDDEYIDCIESERNFVDRDPIVLNYREKNYYYLKKGTKARKKAK